MFIIYFHVDIFCRIIYTQTIQEKLYLIASGIIKFYILLK